MFNLSYRPFIRIASDATTPGTLEFPSGGGEGILVNAKLELRNITIDSTSNSPERLFRCLEEGIFQTRDNMMIQGSAEIGVDIRQASWSFNWSRTTIDGSKFTGKNRELQMHSASFITVKGTNQDFDNGLVGPRAGLGTSTADIDNCTTTIRGQDEMALKQVGGTISNCDTVFDAGNDALIKYTDGVTFSSNNTLQYISEPSGRIINLDQDTQWIGTGVNGTRVLTDSNDTALASFGEKRFALKSATTTIAAFSGGEMRTANTHLSPDESAIVYVTPSVNPGNDHGSDWKTCRDDLGRIIRVHITELENAGGRLPG